MKRLSSYQKLKQENERLKGVIAQKEAEIYVLIRHPKSPQAAEINLRHELTYALDDEIWLGSADKPVTGGLWKQIAESG